DLRLQRGTDLEKLRQVTKQVGIAMAAEPELKGDFLEPLKLQGVVEVADSAIVMRFKTTVHPIRPSYIQREAVKRLIQAFKASGIEFAGAPLAIPHTSTPPETADLALPGKAPSGRPIRSAGARPHRAKDSGCRDRRALPGDGRRQWRPDRRSR